MKSLYLFLPIYLNIYTNGNEYSGLVADKFAGPALHKQLDNEARKAQCCAKKMRCCKKLPPPPNIEIRAVMARCTNPPTYCTKRRKMNKPLYQGNTERLTRFQGFDEDEPLVQSEVTKCNKKLILTMKIKNEGETNTRSQFIVIDHVYDPISSMTVRILNPYVIKLKQDHVSQTYPLKFLDFVNSEAREQVYNKHDGNFTGCYMDDKRPTCGLVKYQGRVIPFSGGYCCSCDAQKNAERQPDMEQLEPKVGPSDPAFLMDAVQCPRTNIKEKFSKDNAKRHDLGGKSDNLFYMKQSDRDGREMYRKYQSKVVRESNGRQQNADEQTLGKSRFGIGEGSDFKKLRGINQNYLGSQYESNGQSNVRENGKQPMETQKYQKSRNTNPKETAKNPNIQSLPTQQAINLNKPSMHKILTPVDFFKPESNPDLARNSNPNGPHNANFPRQIRDLDENSGPPIEDDEDLDLLESIYSKRQVQSSGVQKRGGQNCADRYTPPHLNPDTYHESAHCLRFSPVWYGVYIIEKPLVEQEIVIQIFEKYETECGQVKWKDITDGKKIRLGTFSPYYKDEVPTISLTFNSMYNDENFCIAWRKMRLLIPEGMRVSDLVKYAEAKSGPPEYLVVNSEKIILSGEQCDAAGVGFEAFFKQPNRCSMPRGTCLHHQPKHMWLHDKRLDRSGKKGCYFLKYHGKLAKNPIRKNVTSDERYLTLNYYGRYISMIDMEVNADFNAVLRPSSTGVLTEVYIDSTCPTRTHITIKLTNGGLLSSKFMVRICDCPLDLKGQLNDLKSDLVLISPQNQHIFKLTVYHQLDVDIFHCSVEALNCKGELVALRRIRIQKQDRCICTWHCLCACIGSTKGLKCIAMKLDHFHAAGFRGGLPTTIYAEHEMSTDDIIRITIYLIIFIFVTLLLLGLTKGLIGLCCLPIGSWGLNLLLDLPKPMKHYYEPRLRDRDVVYDSEGWPVHPATGERVRNLPATAEFCANVLFFYTYPTVVLLLVIKRICCPNLSRRKRMKDSGSWFKKKCEAACSNKEVQANSSNTTTSQRGSKKKQPSCCDPVKKDSNRKNPIIKVAITERQKQPYSNLSSSSRNQSPKRKSGNHEDCYCFSSGDEFGVNHPSK
nr:uncharacterized protein LOC111422497 isoform X1 [Onthophagus taurus]